MVGRRSILTLVVAAAVMLEGGAAGQGFIKPGEESFKLNVGGILNEFDTSVRLDGSNLRGTDVNMERSGLAKSASSFDLGATWRFLPRHRVDAQYFDARRHGSSTIDREIEINGSVIPINTVLTSEQKTGYLLANYSYSFATSDSMEVAAGLGFWGGQMKYKFSAQNPFIDISASTTVPLPLLSLGADWYLSRQWSLSARVEGLKLKVGDVNGSALVFDASTEYMVTRNFGLGLAYLYTNIDVDVSGGSFNGSLGWRASSFRGYAQLRF